MPALQSGMRGGHSCLAPRSDEAFLPCPGGFSTPARRLEAAEKAGSKRQGHIRQGLKGRKGNVKKRQKKAGSKKGRKRQKAGRQGQTFNFQFPEKRQGQTFNFQFPGRQGQTFNFQFPGRQGHEKAGSKRRKRQGQEKAEKGRVKKRQKKAGSDFQFSISRGRQGQTFNFQFPGRQEGRVRLSIFNFPAFR